MPITSILIGAAAVTGLLGIFKGGEAVINNGDAKRLVRKAEDLYDRAQADLEEQRCATSKDLDELGKTKLLSWSNDIGAFVPLFSKFKNVEITNNVNLNENLKLKVADISSLRNMEVASLKATEVVRAGISSLGAGALAGIASYGGAMMFATASTGTAIASLSGAAATNATLAWFGGGSLAAGGLGIAGGTAVLGGIVVAPVLAVAGFIMAAKSKENLAGARETYAEAKLAAEKMDTMTDFMKEVSAIANNYNNFIGQFSERYQPILNRLGEIYNEALNRSLIAKIKKMFGLSTKVNYKRLSEEEQKTLQLSWLMTQVLYAVLSAPLLTEDGNLSSEAQPMLEDAMASVRNLIGETECDE